MGCRRRWQVVALGSGLLAAAAGAWAAEPAAGQRLVLVKTGSPQALIVPGPQPSPVEQTAIQKLQAGLLRDGGPAATVPVASDQGDAAACILVGTLAGNPVLARVAEQAGMRLDDLPPQGFVLRTVMDGDRPCLMIAGGDDRGVLYGVQEAVSQIITCTPTDEVYAEACDLRAAPALEHRGTYCLTCWGGAPSYDRQAWEDAIDSMADAGMNRVMFWMDGLFRSTRHPGTFLNKPGEQYAKTRLTTDDIRRLIRFAHDRGMTFYFGSGVFGWFTAGGYIAKQFKDAVDHTGQGLCPSSPTARRVTVEYLSEMNDVFPDADGYMLEIRDEMDDCMCPKCQKVLDAVGSKQFGQSEMDFLDELTAAVWKQHPRTRFIWLMGYANHDHDPMYYERMRTLGRDPRMEWLEVRMNWTLPTPDGKRKPLREFSDKVYHWDPYYRLAPEHMQGRVRQTIKEGLHGYLPAYEPGFANLSIYDTQSETPFPVRLIPFCLTQFYYRTFTWNPQIKPDAVIDRAWREYFSAEVPRQLAEDLLFMRRFMAEHYTELTRTIGRGLGPDGSGLIATVEDIWTVERKGGDKTRDWLLTAVAADIRRFQSLTRGTGNMARVKQIEERIAQYRPTASRRSRASMDLIGRSIDDIRAELAKCGQYVTEADEALARIDKYINLIHARSPATTQPDDK
ncbi:MAG: hypothetical protein HY718_05670 [Planctomycetes bacterium]|nr:hypothetical protein [Planctomycetota bacterium]